MKTPFKNYFTLTKSEWNGTLVLLALIVLVLAAPYIYRQRTAKVYNFTAFNNAVAQLKRAGVQPLANVTNAGYTNSDALSSVRLFKFNPNRLPIKQWQKLGLNELQIKSIKNYETKGGHFYTKADVKKMYTLTSADYERLQPFILLPDDSLHTNNVALVLELNSADSAQLTRLKGIGPAFARRIVQYRQRLGGFCSKRQLKEIFGMDNIRYADVQGQLTLNPRHIKKMHINTIELDDLKLFPYLNYKQANALIQYRKQHGNYESVNELSNVAIIDAATLSKIRPYMVL